VEELLEAYTFRPGELLVKAVLRRRRKPDDWRGGAMVWNMLMFGCVVLRCCGTLEYCYSGGSRTSSAKSALQNQRLVWLMKRRR